MRTKGIIIGIIAAVILGGGAAFLQIQSTARHTEEIGEVLADKNELGITARTKAPTEINSAAYSELAMSEKSRLLYPELAGEIDAFNRKIRELAEQNSSGIYVSIYRADPGILSCTVVSNADENTNTWYWNMDPGTGRPVSLFKNDDSLSYVLEDDGIFLSRVSDHLMESGYLKGMTEEERTTFLRNYYSDPECPRWFMAENELLFSYRPVDFPDGSDDADERTSGIRLSDLGESLCAAFAE